MAGWLIACRRRGIPVVVVAARKGAGWKRWQRVPRIFSWLTRDVQFMYSDDVGDLKRIAPKLATHIELPKGTIVGASTRPGDEQRLIKAWEHLTPPRPKLVIAPRHLNRIDEILNLAGPHKMGRRSQGWQNEDDIWLLDTHGELPGFLAHAHIALIGGTFDPDIGGHSPSEAASGHAHLIRGPHIDANPTAWKDLVSTEVDSMETLHRALKPWPRVLWHNMFEPRLICTPL